MKQIKPQAKSEAHSKVDWQGIAANPRSYKQRQVKEVNCRCSAISSARC